MSWIWRQSRVSLASRRRSQKVAWNWFMWTLAKNRCLGISGGWCPSCQVEKIPAKPDGTCGLLSRRNDVLFWWAISCGLFPENVGIAGSHEPERSQRGFGDRNEFGDRSDSWLPTTQLSCSGRVCRSCWESWRSFEHLFKLTNMNHLRMAERMIWLFEFTTIVS